MDFGQGVIPQRLAHHDKQVLHQVGQRRRRSIQHRNIPDFALGDLDKRSAVAKRVKVTFINDAHVVVAPQGGNMRPF